MGDNLLMKTIYLSLFMLASITLADDLSWVDTQVEAIKPSREGESLQSISKIKDPFIFLKKNASTKDTKSTSKSLKKNVVRSNTYNQSRSSSSKKVYQKSAFTLSAIINNSALINGAWYKINETIKGYKITAIDNTTVTLKKKSKVYVLSTTSKNNKLKFKK